MPVPVRNLPALPAPEHSRSRRERRSSAARQPVLHVVMPGVEVAREVPRNRETVTAFLRRTGWAYRDPKHGWQFRKGLPTILEVNGEAVLRKQWRTTRIASNDNVRFISYPMGGGKGGAKQVIGLVALVALAAFAAPLAGAGLSALGISSSATVIGGLTAGQLATGALLLGGSLLISALTAPKPGATNDPDAKTDQIYSAQAQGNAARLGQPLPVWYGRNRAYPDFAATPWGEFVGNDQYLNVLLSVSVGRMAYEQLLIDDTPFWDSVNGVLPGFASAQVAFYEPGQQVTLFPVNVHQAAEVNGQQLPHGSGYMGRRGGDGSFGGGTATSPGAWLGGYVAVPAGASAYRLAIDYVFPAGCFLVDEDNGNTLNLGVGIRAERRLVDEAGAPIGGWEMMFDKTVTYASRAPIRGTELADCPAGRWEVRFRRNDGVPPDNKGTSELVWAGLRSYLVGNSSFADVSTIAIRIKASESTQGSFKFGVIGTRKLNVWNGSTFVEQATRNPIWAALDIATNTAYGAGHALSKVDFNTIVNQAAAADLRGDSFDYVFTSAVAVPEAIDKALTVTRAKHFWLGDTLSVVRDEWRDVPTQMLTDREIVRDSVQIDVTMLGEEDPDAVIIEYIDENTWRPAQVQYPPEMPGVGGFHAVNAEPKRIDGIQNRQHAYREAAFYYLQSIYRRELVKLDTEYEGRAFTFGQVIRVQSELPMDYGQSGAVLDRDGNELTLSPVPAWATGEQHYVRLRRPTGKSFGPVKVSRGGSDNLAVLDPVDLATVETAQGTTLAAVLARADGAEWPSFELGTADNQARLAMLLGGQPNGDKCTLSLVVDDERVHATDLGSPPVLPAPQFPTSPRAPLIVGLSARWAGGGVAEPKLAASWFPSPGAFYYRAEVSYDGDDSWIQVYEGQDNKFEQVVTPAALKVRVQAIGVMTGPFSEADLAAPTVQIMDNAVALESLKEYLRDQTTELLDNRFQDVWKAIARNAERTGQGLSRTAIDKREVRTQLQARSDYALAEIGRVEQVAVTAEEAVAQLEETVGTEFGPVKAQVLLNTSAISTLDGYAAAQWSVLTDVNGNVAGLVLFNEGASKTSFDVIADAFRVCWPGVTGGDPVPVFTVANVGGVAKLALRGDMLVDGAILARMISAGQVQAVHIQAGSIDSPKIALGGVSILNIIDGAAGYKLQWGTAASTSNPSETLLNQTFPVVSGDLNIIWSSDIYIPSNPSSSTSVTVNLYFNGVNVRSWGWTGNVGDQPAVRDNFSLQWALSGVPAGSRSVQLTVLRDGPANVGAGQLTVIERRR